MHMCLPSKVYSHEIICDELGARGSSSRRNQSPLALAASVGAINGEIGAAQPLMRAWRGIEERGIS
jgi:hypothetical protein